MDILIDDIPEEGLEIEAKESDAWFRGVIEDAVRDSFNSEGEANARISMQKFEGNINIEGNIHFDSTHTCDRCLAEYKSPVDLKIHTALIPLRDVRGPDGVSDDDLELASEDLETGHYEGDRFDLAEVIREQIVLAEPMKHLCRENCAGLCQRCGKDLNDGPCGCGGAVEAGG